MKNLLTVSDLSLDVVERIMELAQGFDDARRQGVRRENILHGKVVAMIFEKPSLRTKVAFEVATNYLGGVPVFLSSSQILASGNNIQGRESIPDIARNLEQFCDLIIARVYSHETLHELVKYLSIPVINALCDKHHPTQVLADLYTIRHKKNLYPALDVAYVGDGNNVATSLLQISALVGMNFSIASPLGYEIPEQEKNVAEKLAKNSGSKIKYVQDPAQAVLNADVVYTDTFVSMGQEADTNVRRQAFQGYQVNSELLSYAKEDAIFMHCLPAHRGEEVTNEVMDCSQSVVFDEAGARLHIAKALLSVLLA